MGSHQRENSAYEGREAHSAGARAELTKCIHYGSHELKS